MKKNKVYISLVALGSILVGESTLAQQALDEKILKSMEVAQKNVGYMHAGSKQAIAEQWGKECKAYLSPDSLFAHGSGIDKEKATARLEQIKGYKTEKNHGWTQTEKDITEILDDCDRASAVAPKRSLTITRDRGQKVGQDDLDRINLDLRRLEDKVAQNERSIIALSKALPSTKDPMKKGR